MPTGVYERSKPIAAAVRAKLSRRKAGNKNPQFGKSPVNTRTFSVSGLSHRVRTVLEGAVCVGLKERGIAYAYRKRRFVVRDVANRTQMTYTPSLWLVGTNVFVDCCGSCDELTKRKMAAFTRQFPTLELWIVAGRYGWRKIPAKIFKKFYTLVGLEKFLADAKGHKK